VRERISAFKEAGVTNLTISLVGGQDPIKTVEQMRELVDEA
jgi:hypothetical protein